MVEIIIMAEVILVPILGLLWWGAREERLRIQRISEENLRMMGVIRISKGRGKR